MKRIVYRMLPVLTVALLTTACEDSGKKDTQNAADTETVVESPAFEEVKKQVNAIYKEVFSLLGTNDYYSLESKYCSDEFWTLLKECRLLEDEENLVIDWDLFLQAQDWDKPKMEILSLEPGEKGTVTVNMVLKDLGEERDCRLVMIKENGEWRIDDFPYPTEEGGWMSVKQLIKDFVK